LDRHGIMRISSFVIVATGFVLFLANGFSQSTAARAIVVSAHSHITIDGRLEELEWQTALPIGELRPKHFLNVRQMFHEFSVSRFVRLDQRRVENWRVFTAPVNYTMNSGDRYEFNYAAPVRKALCAIRDRCACGASAGRLSIHTVAGGIRNGFQKTVAGHGHMVVR
jgi:hypothetical protein